jgi:hypothetical protein
MKTSRIILILVLSVIISALLHYLKLKKGNDEIDNISNALAPVCTFIKPGSTIAFSGEPDKLELFVWSRYILAPAILTEATTAQTPDTLLAIKYATTDTMPQARHIIWQNKDQLYHYTLTTTN